MYFLKLCYSSECHITAIRHIWRCFESCIRRFSIWWFNWLRFAPTTNDWIYICLNWFWKQWRCFWTTISQCYIYIDIWWRLLTDYIKCTVIWITRTRFWITGINFDCWLTFPTICTISFYSLFEMSVWPSTKHCSIRITTATTTAKCWFRVRCNSSVSKSYIWFGHIWISSYIWKSKRWIWYICQYEYEHVVLVATKEYAI